MDHTAEIGGPDLVRAGGKENDGRRNSRVTQRAGRNGPGILKTSAVRDGDSWIINGRKIWTSFGEVADYCYLISRTGRDGPPGCYGRLDGVKKIGMPRRRATRRG